MEEQGFDRFGRLPDLGMRSRIYPEPLIEKWNHSHDSDDDEEEEGVDHFDRIPDSLLLLVFNKIGDVKVLGRCCVVSRRFQKG